MAWHRFSYACLLDGCGDCQQRFEDEESETLPLTAIDPPRCLDCHEILSSIEATMYSYRCERCEGLWHERISAWRHGADDRELDEQFGEHRTTH